MARAMCVTKSSDFSLNRWWAISFIVIAMYLAIWWFHLRPGIFSYDSGFYLQEVLSGNYTNTKPFLYARFLQLTSGGGTRFELSVLAQAFLVALALSRIFAIALFTKANPIVVAVGIIIVANPYAANMALYVQNDILFSVAIMLILIESLFIARQSSITKSNMVLIGLFAPMALFFRANGLLFLPLWALVFYFSVERRLWVRLVAVATITSGLAYASVVGVKTSERQDPLYFVVIHEAVGLARPEYGIAPRSRLSPSTRQAIGEERLNRAESFYWSLYFDTIAFVPGGPMLLELSPAQRSAVVKNFLRHDLAPNLPSVVGHRLEMFLAACLARGVLVDPYAAPTNLPPDLVAIKAHTASKVSGGTLARINQASIRWRAWTWNALFGFLALLGFSLVSVWRRDRVLLLLASTLWVQAAMILAALPAAEYRYVFMFYLAPLLMLVGPSVRTARPRQPNDSSKQHVPDAILPEAFAGSVGSREERPESASAAVVRPEANAIPALR
ncbi:MAG: hypothetical protein M3451_02975 [Chloroflexota bacterium]|nr:hypothetical protein [Chloroflexota bacterium]